MSTIELEATRKDIFRMLLNVDDENILTEIKYFLYGTNALYPDVPMHYSSEALHKVVEMSEEAICKGQTYTNEQVRSKHPRL